MMERQVWIKVWTAVDQDEDDKMRTFHKEAAAVLPQHKPHPQVIPKCWTYPPNSVHVIEMSHNS